MIDYVTTSTPGACIRVVGVGGGGGNAVDNMIRRGLQGVEYIVANTDLQALDRSLAPIKVQLGKELTKGLGAGANPDIGRQAAEETLDEIRNLLEGSDMVFVTAGMGGGTGTGAAPLIAQVARELQALVVGIVTKPFAWEAKQRMKIAEAGIAEMRQHVDALIVIPNQRLLEIIDPHTPLMEAFLKVDEVLYNATRGIADIISGVGYINVDFADVRTIMANTGDALMGIGTATGENRALEAAQSAIASPLLDGISIEGARGLLINITADPSLTMQEVSDAISFIEKSAGEEVNLIHGVVFDESLQENPSITITVIATGFSAQQEQHQHTSRQASAQTAPLHPTAAPAAAVSSPPPQTLPTPPRGSDQLKRYDTPAYIRRSAQNTDQSEPVPKTGTMDKPAFLRKIMD